MYAVTAYLFITRMLFTLPCIRKILQKVPYKEVSEGFAALCQSLQQKGQLQYTAMCMLSAAKAELEEVQQGNQAQSNIFGFGAAKPKAPEKVEQKGQFILGGYFFVNSGIVPTFFAFLNHNNNVLTRYFM